MRDAKKKYLIDKTMRVGLALPGALEVLQPTLQYKDDEVAVIINAMDLGTFKLFSDFNLFLFGYKL